MEEHSRQAESRKWKPFFRFVKLRKKRASGTASSSASSLSTPATNEIPTCIESPADTFTDKMVYEFIWDYHEQFRLAIEALPDTESPNWKDFWPNFHTTDFLFVRPSGNSLTLKGMIAQLETGIITHYEEDVIMVENIKCFGEIAVLVYKSETRLFYKGTRVEDSRTNTIVIVWEDGRPKITNIQRSQGRKDNQ